MKLHREKFLAAAMMLSTASGGGCRTKVDQGSEGINPEGANNVSATSPNGEIGQDLAGGQNRPLQLRAEGQVKVGVGFAPAPLRGPVAEGRLPGPTTESLPAPTREPLAAPTNEKFGPAPTLEKFGPAPTLEKRLPGPVNEKVLPAPIN